VFDFDFSITFKFPSQPGKVIDLYQELFESFKPLNKTVNLEDLKRLAPCLPVVCKVRNASRIVKFE
jgi:hypothetical protein